MDRKISWLVWVVVFIFIVLVVSLAVTMLRRSKTTNKDTEEPNKNPSEDTSIEGVRVSGETKFWNCFSVCAFVRNLSESEVNNIVAMTKYMNNDLADLIIVSLVTYDTSANNTKEDWILDKCVVIRGTQRYLVSIVKTDGWYSIDVDAFTSANTTVKIGLWPNAGQDIPSTVANVQYIINETSGLEYYDSIKYAVVDASIIDVVDGFTKFTFPSNTTSSFPKLVDFTTKINKYIVYPKLVPDTSIRPKFEKLSYALISLTLKEGSRYSGFDLSEIINYISISKLDIQIGGFIIQTKTAGQYINKPDKEYSLSLGQYNYNTSMYMFTDDPSIVLFSNTAGPPVYDSTNDLYKIGDIHYKKNLDTSVAVDAISYYGPTEATSGRVEYKLSSGGQAIGQPQYFSYANMDWEISNITRP